MPLKYYFYFNFKSFDLVDMKSWYLKWTESTKLLDWVKMFFLFEMSMARHQTNVLTASKLGLPCTLATLFSGEHQSVSVPNKGFCCVLSF